MDRFSPTQESDVFGLAMTFLNAWSGEPPFPQIKNEQQVIIAVRNGERPERPTSSLPLDPASSGEFWSLLVEMWADEKAKRPTSEKVSASIEAVFHRCEWM
ncbi:hypothetical protein DL93DRAFT_2085527 [Clavulina sp. PMI_390]|nr:hypothetical protein DL93DRAFT_2085527 [Clavulina sp. PMI_390]